MKDDFENGANLSSFETELESSKKGIAARIRKIRSSRTAAAFAAEYGIGLSTLNRWEKGETAPDGALLGIIARREGVDGHWLLTGAAMARSDADNGARLAHEEMLLLLDCFIAVEGIMEKNGRHPTREQKKALAIKMLDDAKLLDDPGLSSPQDLGLLDSRENRA